MSCGPHRNRFLEVQTEIRVNDQRQTNFVCRSECIGKTQPDFGWRLCRHSPLDVDTRGNADGNRPRLDNGQTVLMRTPTQTEFVECRSETIIRNGLARIFLRLRGARI